MDNEVQKYIDKQDSSKKEILEKLRKLIQKTTPLAQMTIFLYIPTGICGFPQGNELLHIQ
jgi:uncharacterized protein YdhG (YjbR/CyaY superfamily)